MFVNNAALLFRNTKRGIVRADPSSPARKLPFVNKRVEFVLRKKAIQCYLCYKYNDLFYTAKL